MKWKEYRKTATIKAVQVTEENITELPDVDWALVDDDEDITFWIKTLEGDMQVKIGDWLAEGAEGEHYPIKDSIFV